jgi:hypothetical protein
MDFLCLAAAVAAAVKQLLLPLLLLCQAVDSKLVHNVRARVLHQGHKSLAPAAVQQQRRQQQGLVR